jgi:L-threonylcarbamoyladenylate synthase
LIIINKFKKINSKFPSRQYIRETVDILDKGGLVAFPTRCLYGLGADAMNAGAVDRVFQIKQRPLDKPLLVLVAANYDIEKLVQDIPQTAIKIMDSFWPGRVTIVFKAAASLPRNLLGRSGKLGIRVPGHPVAGALVKAFGRPITGTSANLSGQAGCCRIEDFNPLLVEQLDLILDAGPLKGGSGSTVVDVTGENPVILREGEVARSDILKAV